MLVNNSICTKALRELELENNVDSDFDKHVFANFMILKDGTCKTDVALCFVFLFLAVSLQYFVVSGVSAWPEDATSRQSATTTETGVWDSQ